MSELIIGVNAINHAPDAGESLTSSRNPKGSGAQKNTKPPMLAALELTPPREPIPFKNTSNVISHTNDPTMPARMLEMVEAGEGPILSLTVVKWTCCVRIRIDIYAAIVRFVSPQNKRLYVRRRELTTLEVSANDRIVATCRARTPGQKGTVM